jgi:hypothetical protein
MLKYFYLICIFPLNFARTINSFLSSDFAALGLTEHIPEMSASVLKDEAEREYKALEALHKGL